MRVKLCLRILAARFLTVFLVSIAFLSLLAPAVAQGEPDMQSALPRYGVFVFSNFCQSQESGDFYGFRITLLRYGDDDYVMVEWSDGPHNLSLGYDVEIDPQGSHIEFLVRTAYDPDDPDSYSGTFIEDALLLNFRNSNQTHRLTRVQDFSHEIGTCS